MSSITETQESNDDSIGIDRSIIDVSDVVEILTGLQLSIIPQDYVDQVMNSHYDYYKFPEYYESIFMSDIQFPSIINDSCELLNIYLQQSSSMDIVWDQFINNAICIHPKPLSCLLNCYIQNGIKDINDSNIRKNGLSAIRLFFLASTFKGSKNIGFYHICILTKSSELIKSCITMLNITKSNDREIKLNEEEKNDLIIDLSAIVRDITIMVKRFKFFDDINSLNLIFEILIDMTRMERVSGNILERVPTEKLSFSSLAFNAYSCLTYMFNDNCGSTFTIGQKLMHYLLPGLLLDEQREMQLSTKQFNVIRDHHLAFIRKLTVKLETPFQIILEILFQSLLHRGLDCNELKPRQFQILLEVWRLFSNETRIQMKHYLLQMVHNKTHSDTKTVALEILFSLLSEPEESEPEDLKLLPLMPATKHEFIVVVILSQLLVSNDVVRSKAFTLILTLTAGPPTATAHQTALANCVLFDHDLNVLNIIESFSENTFYSFKEYLLGGLAKFDKYNISKNNICSSSKILWSALHEPNHQRDSLLYKRITLLQRFLIYVPYLDYFSLELLSDSCLDNSFSVKQVAASELTNLILKYPYNQNVLLFWLEGLIHLLNNPDKRIQDLTIECMQQVILKNIKPYSSKLIDDNNPLDFLPWYILDTVLDKEADKYMMRLCESWQTRGFLTDRIVNDLITYVDRPNFNWTIHSLFLLQLISHQRTITNISPIVGYFNTQYDSWFSNNDPIELNRLLTNSQIVLDILFLNYKCLDVETRKQILDKVESSLFDFKVPAYLISKSLELYTVLLSDDPGKRDTNFKKLFKIICNFIKAPTNMQDEEIMIRHIYTLGDINLNQHLQIPSKLQQLLLGFLNNTNKSVSLEFQASVVLIIGKLSVVDEPLAKEAIVKFGIILKNSYHPSIKINTLIALSKLCPQYTTLIEQTILEMFVCLKNENISVKMIALKLLTSWILEDYIKLNNVAFFALSCMLNDPDKHVREKTATFIINYLLIKNKNIMEQKLIEVIFNFNGYTVRNYSLNYYSKLKTLFPMDGKSNESSRHEIYEFVLTNMTNSMKLKLMKKMFNVFFDIVKDVNSTSNNVVKEHAIEVMKDAFWILNSKKMALKTDNPHNSIPKDEMEKLDRMTKFAKNKLVLEVFRDTIIKYIIPCVLKLEVELKASKKLCCMESFLCTYVYVLILTNYSMKKEIFNALSVNEDLLHTVKLKIKKKEQSEKNLCCRKYDLEFNNYEDVQFIHDLKYVTWFQLTDIDDQEKKWGIDKFTQK